jgi:hypothetical protein
VRAQTTGFILTKWNINLRKTLVVKVHISEFIRIFIHITNVNVSNLYFNILIVRK